MKILYYQKYDENSTKTVDIEKFLRRPSNGHYHQFIKCKMLSFL